MATTVTLNRAEVKVLVNIMNNFLDQERDEVYSNPALTPIFVLEVRPFLKKLLVAALMSGDMEIPRCFAGDETLLKAADIGRALRR